MWPAWPSVPPFVSSPSVNLPLAAGVSTITSELAAATHINARYGGDTAMSTARIGARGDHGDLQRAHLGLGLLQPEPHAHLVEQARCGCELFRRPLIACSPVKLADAELAISDERAHAQLYGQSCGTGVMGFGRHHVQAVATCGRLAEEVMGPSLVTAFSALAGERHRTGAKVPRLLHPTREKVRLAELYHAHRAQISDPAGIAG